MQPFDGSRLEIRLIKQIERRYSQHFFRFKNFQRVFESLPSLAKPHLQETPIFSLLRIGQTVHKNGFHSTSNKRLLAARKDASLALESRHGQYSIALFAQRARSKLRLFREQLHVKQTVRIFRRFFTLLSLRLCRTRLSQVGSLMAWTSQRRPFDVWPPSLRPSAAYFEVQS